MSQNLSYAAVVIGALRANFKENYHFPRFQRGSNIFQGEGVQLFPEGGGGTQLLIPYINPYNL